MTGGGRRGGEKQMVPEADFSSYYGRPVLKETVWGPDIPSYLFLGGLAGASSALAAAAQLSGRPELPPSRRTHRCCSPTPRYPPGTTLTASCRSCSPDPP